MAKRDVQHRVEGSVDRPVVVLSNSLATTTAIWDSQMPALLRDHAVIRYDHPGHGSSPPIDRRWTVADLASDVIALLDRLGVGRFSFCGLSLGGMVGLQVASDAPERVQRLVGLQHICSTRRGRVLERARRPRGTRWARSGRRCRHRPMVHPRIRQVASRRRLVGR